MLLEIISEPIKAYLRKRHDTLRCIINNIINPNEEEENNELQ